VKTNQLLYWIQIYKLQLTDSPIALSIRCRIIKKWEVEYWVKQSIHWRRLRPASESRSHSKTVTDSCHRHSVSILLKLPGRFSPTLFCLLPPIPPFPSASIWIRLICINCEPYTRTSIFGCTFRSVRSLWLIIGPFPERDVLISYYQLRSTFVWLLKI